MCLKPDPGNINERYALLRREAWFNLLFNCLVDTLTGVNVCSFWRLRFCSFWRLRFCRISLGGVRTYCLTNENILSLPIFDMLSKSFTLPGSRAGGGDAKTLYKHRGCEGF